MRQFFLIVACCLAGILCNIPSAGGNTHAPTAQTFVLQCGGETVTFVSPTEPARAAQVVGTTGVGVLQQVVLSDDSGQTVLFEQPSFHAHKASALTICTLAVPGGMLTFVILATPQDEENP